MLLFASAVVGGIGIQNGGWLLEWILFAALWGLAFAYRGRMLALLSLGGHHEHHRGIEAAAATMGAVALTRAAGRRVVTQPARDGWSTSTLTAATSAATAKTSGARARITAR